MGAIWRESVQAHTRAYHQRMTLMTPTLSFTEMGHLHAYIDEPHTRIQPPDDFDGLYSYWYTHGHIRAHTTDG